MRQGSGFRAGVRAGAWGDGVKNPRGRGRGGARARRGSPGRVGARVMQRKGKLTNATDA